MKFEVRLPPTRMPMLKAGFEEFLAACGQQEPPNILLDHAL